MEVAFSKYFVSNWIDIVREDTLWQDKYEMNKEELDTFIGLRLSKKKSEKDVRKKLVDFYAWIAEKVMKYEKIYIRWDNRSPKDWWHYNGTNIWEAMGKPSPIASAKQAIKILLESERLLEDIYTGLFNGVFWIAPYKELSDEVRIFVYKKQIIGISQYYKAWERWLDDNLGWILSKYLKLLFRYKERLDNRFGSYIIDIGWNRTDKKAVIIEVNPYARITYPGLFEWQELEKLEKEVDKNGTAPIAIAVMQLKEVKGFIGKNDIKELLEDGS